MRGFAIAAAGCLALVSPVCAQDIDWNRIDLARERAAIGHFQALDQRLQDVGWKLVSGNSPFCEKTIPSIGLQLQDMASYGSPEIARRALDLSGSFAVQTSARGSPSSANGSFVTNREIASIAGEDLNAWEAGARLHWQRLTKTHDHVDTVLRRDRAITVGFADGESVSIEPVTVCATRFELMGDGTRAVADGNRVVIGMNFPAFSYVEPVFAGVVAHELAHNLLGHREWLDRNGRSQGNVRRTEREADRLMPWLLANAGYDPVAAQVFFERWGPGNDGGFFRNRNHEGWDERAENVAGELAQVRALLAQGGRADWSVHFRREIAPDKGL